MKMAWHNDIGKKIISITSKVIERILEFDAKARIFEAPNGRLQIKPVITSCKEQLELSSLPLALRHFLRPISLFQFLFVTMKIEKASRRYASGQAGSDEVCSARHVYMRQMAAAKSLAHGNPFVQLRCRVDLLWY